MVSNLTLTKETQLLRTPKPGMGKGKARGMGAAEYGGKFSGVY